MSYEILLGGNGQSQVSLLAKTANRHGMIAGATGTGKTVTLQVLAENFSAMGVPVFLADVKGDLSGLAKEIGMNDKITSRLETIGIKDFAPQANPTLFWDLYGKQGHPIRTTISDMGPLLLSSLLELNDTQTGILYAAFSIADDNGMLLLDLKDLRSMLNWMGANSKDLSSEYGNITSASLGAIQRRLLVLEEQGAEYLLGEPALNLNDLMITDFSGRGVVSILDVTGLMSKSPRVYATFLLWLLAELFETLPEVGDPEKPKLVLFFDEAHLLFDRAPRPLLDKIEQVVRLIRSKGVSVFFISQSPLDIPPDILGQLGARIQHALRAFTPKDQKAVRTVAQTFRENPELDTEKVITELGTGEALVSVLAEDGSPTPVERVLIRPPQSRIGPLTDAERTEVLGRSPLKGRYDTAVDRESAFEMLKKRAEEESRVELAENARAEQEKEAKKDKSKGNMWTGTSRRQGVGEAIVKSVVRSVGSSLGRQIVRGILGSLLGGKR
jgi:DNA double-strand break repair helicase HerA and related ATPase